MKFSKVVSPLRRRPKGLEALKVTKDTYIEYERMCAKFNFPALPLIHCNNHFIIRKREDPTDWGWCDEKNFREQYEWVGQPTLDDPWCEIRVIPEIMD